MSYLIDTDTLPKRDEKTIRLIDAEAIDYNDYWWHKGYTARDCQQAAKLIGEQPTVEAMPIEFIRKEITNSKGFYNSSLWRLIERWKDRDY